MMGFEESVRSPKVLQGQENAAFMSLYYGCDIATNQSGFELSSSSHPVMNVHPFSYAGFMETNNSFPRVLQGQEICKLNSLTGKVDFNLGAWGTKPNVTSTTFNLHQPNKPNFQSAYFPYGDIHKVGQATMLSSKTTNFQRENVSFNTPSTQIGNIRSEVGRFESCLPNEHKLQDNISVAASLGDADIRIPNDNNVKGKVNNACKLFGFPLSGETSTQNLQNTAKRSCKKVRDDNNKKIL